MSNVQDPTNREFREYLLEQGFREEELTDGRMEEMKEDWWVYFIDDFEHRQRAARDANTFFNY